MAEQLNLDMALDLLVARAALDGDLRQELLANPQAQCLENGIKLPEDTQLVFKNPESTVIIKEIPVLQQNSKTVLATENTTRELVSNGFNTTVETTEQAVQTTVDVEVGAQAMNLSLTTAQVEAVAVAVIVLT